MEIRSMPKATPTTSIVDDYSAIAAAMREQASDPDADVIAMCDRVVEIRGEIEEIHNAVPLDEDIEMTPELERLHAEESALLDRCWAEEITTLAGARAMARMTLAICPRHRDGSKAYDGDCDSERFAFELAVFLAGKGADL